MDNQLKVLIDTNVWIDKYLMDRKLSGVSKSLLTLCIDDDIAVLYPLRSLHDVFWQVARDVERWVRQSYGDVSEQWAHVVNERAWDCINNMMEVGTPVGADGSDVWVAQHLREIHPDFEDNMVLAAAERAQVDYLVTSDTKLIQKATVAALTPQDMLVVLKIRRARHS
ncbi:MAG: PIN domain-containing protein [Atopobiaceae bacterium]|nr:PIN domain-containing protein [Atopobiaceae bacterium]